MAGWHHQFNGHEFEQTPGDSEKQGSLACCSSGDPKESDMTQWLNNKVATRIPLSISWKASVYLQDNHEALPTVSVFKLILKALRTV